jgi:hypothetical protein
MRRVLVFLPLLFLALEVSCSQQETTGAPASTTTPPPVSSPSTAPSESPSPTPSPTPTEVKVAVPDLAGKTKTQAIAALHKAGLRAKSKTMESTRAKNGRVFAQSIKPGKRVPKGTLVSFTLAKAPPPPPTNCDPAYPDVCLHDGIGDYDCAGGSGNGPNYVTGPIRVLSPDPFGLDSDGDGFGCE